MPFNGSDGTYTLSDTIAPATLADANELQAILNDIQTALTAAFCKDGESTISGAVKGFDGTVSLPGYSFSGDLDSGLYRIGANNIGLTLGGAKVVDYATTGVSVTGTLGGSGNFAIATTKFTVAAASGNTIIAGTATITGDVAVNTNKFTVTASSGNTAVAGTLAVTGAVTLSSTASVASTLTASNGFTVSAGAISVPAGSITGLALTDATVTAAKFASGISAPVLLATLTASNSAALSDITSLTATYPAYELWFDSIVPASNGVDCRLRVHSGGAYKTSGYIAATNQGTSGSAAGANGYTTFIACAASGSLFNGASGLSGRITVFNPSANAIHAWVGTFHHYQASGVCYVTAVSGTWNTAGVIDGFQVDMSAGNITSGTIRIYGIPG